MSSLPNHPVAPESRRGALGAWTLGHSDMLLRKSQEHVRVNRMTTPADRVRDLVASSGVSQGDYAQSVGLDPTKLSKSLSGARRFSSLDLARIAERSHVTVDWLLTGDQPVMATAARAAKGSATEVAVAEAERLVELRESAARLGYPQPYRPLPPRVATSGPASGRSRWRADIAGAELAAEALARLGSMDLDPIALDLASVVETAFGVDVAITSLGQGFDGLSVSTERARLILTALTTRAYRQRFTIAHELGHLLAGDDQGVHLDRDVFASGDTSERRANAFAGAFLMPETILRGRVGRGFDRRGFAALAISLMVSPQALAIRLRDMRLIDAGAADDWRAMTAVEAGRVAGVGPQVGAAAAYSTSERRPGLLARDLFAAYLDERTTLRPYANLLGVDTDTLRADLERNGEADR